MDDGSEGTFYDWNALERMEQFGHRRPSSDARTEVVVSPDLSHANDVAAEEAESEPMPCRLCGILSMSLQVNMTESKMNPSGYVAHA